MAMKKGYYVDNVVLTAEVVKYAEDYRAKRAAGVETPRMNDYLGATILKIAQKIASRPNFSGYSYRADLISDGIINVCLYLHNFDILKSQNSFGYISQIVWYGFLRTINKEKKIYQTKQKYVSHVGVLDRTDTQQNADDRQYHTAIQDMFRGFADKTDMGENKKNTPLEPKPKKQKGLEVFMG